MRLFKNWLIVGALAGMLGSVSVLAFQPELPEDYAPVITYCPAGPESLPGGHVVALLEAALACAELELIDDAMALYIAAMARQEVDEELIVPLEESAELVAFRRLALALEAEFESRFSDSYAEAAAALLGAFERVFGWIPDADAYDPGYAIESLPSAQSYHQAFRMEVASAYAAQVLILQVALEPEFAELSRQLHQPPNGRISNAEMQRMTARLVMLQREVDERFMASFEPTILEARFIRYGVYESFGEIRHIPAPDTADGTRISPELTEFHESSLVIPAEVGLAFGFDYEIAGIVPGTEDRLLMRAIHPPMRNLAGDLQTVSTTPFDIHSWGGRVDEHLSYRFSKPHQLLPGEWTLQVLYFDQVVLSKTFQVVAVDD